MSENNPESLSRRRFLKKATVASGATLLGAAPGVAMNAEPTITKPRKPSPYCPTRAEMMAAFDRQKAYDALVRRPVFKMRIDPHWFGDNTRFWYRNDGAEGTKEFILVDAAHGTRQAAFDQGKLATALSQAAGTSCTAERLPFDAIAFADDSHAIYFSVKGTAYRCDLTTYACTRASGETKPSAEDAPDSDSETSDPKSVDHPWEALVRDHNVWIRAKSDGAETALTRDGTEDHPYAELSWSPDGKTIIGYRVTPVVDKDVYLIESSPKQGWRGVLHQHDYPQAGDPFPAYELWLFDPVTHTATRADMEPTNYGDLPEIRWRADGRHGLIERTERGHQRFRLIEIDAQTGKSRTIIDEQTKTFINTSNAYLHYLKGAAEVLYISEQDGWRHLYFYDVERGARKNRITQGDWVVRAVDRVDEKARQIWFQGSGRNPGEDPYHLHHYRVNFDGTGLVALTEGDGNHTVQYSPDRRYLIDTYSRADQPPIHVLRRTADGTHVCDLERSDISALTSSGWRAPEVFRAKGRDGHTDIWGVVFRPTHLDPNRRYPVIENIYAGPQDSFVRKTFAVRDEMQSLAELGFIVIQCDGMGTRNRSKAFHDVCWRNLKDAGLPDRIAWIKALAQKYPYCDTERVGIYGTSAGGQSSTGALLLHPEFYKVAVSSCGCHDNRIDKRWWNEQWMGYPVGPWYAESSNITLALNLRGKLLLMVGELDTNVPPESTIRLTDALIKAGKDYDLLVLPGLNHTGGGSYGERRRRDYFIRHLLGIEPPDRNVPPPPPPPPIALPAHRANEEYLARPDGGEETNILFRNRTKQEVSLFWLPGDGTHKPYGTIGAGEDRPMHTFAGHTWLVVAPDGHGLAIFVADPHPGIADIQPTP